MAIKVKGCTTCPLFIESTLGEYCAHPMAGHNEESDPFAKQRANGLWVAPDSLRPVPESCPERCPLRVHGQLVLETQ